jgi:hypothetical protein
MKNGMKYHTSTSAVELTDSHSQNSLDPQ